MKRKAFKKAVTPLLRTRARQTQLRYATLANVLQRAYEQASVGKGAVRHAQGKPFESQPMLTLSEFLGTNDGLLFQAIKKVQESKRLPPQAAVFELLGAINYLAGAVIYIEAKRP